MNATLEMVERNDLQYHEQRIEKGLSTFIEVGESLAKIRDSRLYRESYDTFEEYCRERWGFTDNYARRLMTSSEVVKSVPMGTVTSERQARELAKVEPEKREQVIQKAQESTGGKVTARAIRDAATPAELNTPKYKEFQGSTRTFDVTDANQFANMAIRQLERIRNDDPTAKKELVRVQEWIAKKINDL